MNFYFVILALLLNVLNMGGILKKKLFGWGGVACLLFCLSQNFNKYFFVFIFIKLNYFISTQQVNDKIPCSIWSHTFQVLYISQNKNLIRFFIRVAHFFSNSLFGNYSCYFTRYSISFSPSMPQNAGCKLFVNGVYTLEVAERRSSDDVCLIS